MDRQIQRTLGGEFETHDCPHNLNFPSVTNHVGVMGSQCPARQSMWQRGERSDGWRSWGVITIPVGQCVNVRVKDTCEDIVCMLGEWRLSSAHRGLGRAGFLFVGNISNHGKDKSPGGGSLPRGKRTTGECGERKVRRHRGESHLQTDNLTSSFVVCTESHMGKAEPHRRNKCPWMQLRALR